MSDITIPSSKEQEILINQLRHTRPETPEELHAYIKYFFGLDFCRDKICPDHDAEFDYLVHSFFNEEDCVVAASRGAGKTEAGGTLTVMEAIHKAPIHPRIIGGSLEQGEKLYSYTLDKWDRPGFREFLLKEPMKRETKLKNGNDFKILTQSAKSIRNVRTERLRCDELDEFEPKIWKAVSFCTKSNDKVKGSIELLSTIHKAGGIMSDAIKKAKEVGTRVFSWCFLDVLEPCPPARKCLECAIREDCHGIAKDKKYGFYRIDDACKVKMRTDDDSWQIEMLMKSPDYRDLIFQAFSKKIHVVPDFYNPSWRMYRGFDFGTTDPFVILWAQMDQDDNIYIIDEYWKTGLAPSDAAGNTVIEEKRKNYSQIFGSFCEPASSFWRAEFNKKGIFTAIKMAKIEEGITRILERLKRNPLTNKPKLYICKRCTKLIEEIEKFDKTRYHKGIFDHGISALRYICTHLPISSDFRQSATGGYRRGGEKEVFYRRDYKPKVDQFVSKIKKEIY